MSLAMPTESTLTQISFDNGLVANVVETQEQVAEAYNEAYDGGELLLSLTDTKGDPILVDRDAISTIGVARDVPSSEDIFEEGAAVVLEVIDAIADDAANLFEAGVLKDAVDATATALGFVRAETPETDEPVGPEPEFLDGKCCEECQVCDDAPANIEDRQEVTLVVGIDENGTLYDLRAHGIAV